MRGDGHTAYGGNSACIDEAVDGYLLELTLPPRGLKCRQEVPLTAPEPALRRSSAASVENAIREARVRYR